MWVGEGEEDVEEHEDGEESDKGCVEDDNEPTIDTGLKCRCTEFA